MAANWNDTITDPDTNFSGITEVMKAVTSFLYFYENHYFNDYCFSYWRPSAF